MTSYYTREQVVQGLARWIHRDCGKPVVAQTRICWEENSSPDDEANILWVGDDFDLLWLLMRVERALGLDWDCQEFWNLLFPDCVEPLTIGELADRLIPKLPAVSFAPRFVLGKRCASAGAYLGMQELIRQIDPDGPPFGPSTRYLQRLHGRALRTFWNRLEWLSGGLIPPRLEPTDEQHPARRQADWFVLLGGIAWIFVLMLARFPGEVMDAPLVLALAVIGLSLFGPIVLLYFVAHWLVGKLATPQPCDLVTFRDLAKRLARVR